MTTIKEIKRFFTRPARLGLMAAAGLMAGGALADGFDGMTLVTNDWFDADFRGLTAGTVITQGSTTGISSGAGSWTSVPASATAQIVADAGGEATLLSIDVDTSDVLTFSPAPNAITSGYETVSVDFKTDPVYDLPDMDSGVQGAFMIYQDAENALSLQGYTANGWTNLVGATASDLTNVWMTVYTDYATVSNARYVRYSVKLGDTLTILHDSSDTTWFPSAAISKTALESVSFIGSGKIRTFSGKELTEATVILDHSGTLTGYATIADAVAAATSGDTITLKETALVPSTLLYTASGVDKSGVTFSVHGVEIAAVYDGSANTTWTTDGYYHWTGEGTDTNWTTPANWGLASGYPGSGVNSRNTYTSSTDAVRFAKNAEVTVTGTVYTPSITLENSVSVTFTGGGSIKTAYNNNSGTLQLLGSGEVHMKGITFYVPYSTSWKDDGSIQVPLVVDSGANKIYIGGNSNRYGQLNITSTGAIQGSGSIEFEAAYLSSSRIYINGDTSSFSGTATFNAQIFTLPVGGSGRWVIGSDDVANAITSISFSGGTLSLPDTVTTDVSAKIAAGTHTAAVKVDTGTVSREWASAITGSHGFTKSGSGTLTLATAPTYTGATTVSEGILVVPVGTTFGGAVTIAEGAKIQFAADPEWADGSEQTICTFATGSAPDADTLSRIEITGFGGRQSAELNYNSGTGEYVATVTSPTLVWNGADGANWGDTGVWLVGGEATTYMSGDKVSFTDASFTGETTELTVNVGADVDPSLVTIAPDTGHTYKFTGTGKVTTADLVVAATGAGTVKLVNDVFSELEIETAGMVTVAAGEGAVTLAKVTSSSGSTALTVSSGSLTLTEGLGCVIQNDSTLILDGTFNLNKTITGTSADAELVIRGTIDRSQDGYYAWLNGYAGKFILEDGATYKYSIRNAGSYYSNRNLFGNGAVELQGGTIASLDTNSPVEVSPVNSVNVPDGATVTFERRTGNSDRATRLVLSGTLTGSGTMNSDRTLALGCTDAAGFAGTVNWTHTYASTVNNITAATATSADATYNVSGAPASATQLIGLHFSGTAEMGAFNVSSANAQVGVNNANVELEIGAKANSTLNGQFITNPLAITKVGATSTLSLGSAFWMESGSAINVNEGKLSVANGLELTGVNVTMADGTAMNVTLTDTSSTEDQTLFTTTGKVTLYGTQTVVTDYAGSSVGYWTLDASTDDDTTKVKAKFASSGSMDDTTAVVTDTTGVVNIPSTATTVQVAITGNDAVLKSSLDLTAANAVTVYATDASGVKTATDITGAFKVTAGEGNTYTVALDDTATVGGKKVKPEVDTTDEAPMSVDGGTPTFAVKAINGLWYAVEAADSPNGFDSATLGTPVQATDGMASPVAPAFEGNVKYYKIAVGASKAALTPTP